jgi:hypothetical protein
MGDPRQPSWGEVLDTVLTSRLLGVHTAMVGEIRSYSEADQTAEVTLAVQLEGAGGDFETLPPLADVPVLWPGAWAAGDTCLVCFMEENFSKWWDTRSVEPPEVLRRHGLHAICLPFPAREGDAVDFVALKTPTESGLTDLLDGIISAAGSVTAPGGGPAFVAALNVFKTSYLLGLQVGATKVKAR